MKFYFAFVFTCLVIAVTPAQHSPSTIPGIGGRQAPKVLNPLTCPHCRKPLPGLTRRVRGIEQSVEDNRALIRRLIEVMSTRNAQPKKTIPGEGP